MLFRLPLKFTRFKQDFLLDLQVMFNHMLDLTEPICQKIDKQKASMLLFDTSGIEAWVTENNPKYANRIIKQLKTFKKANGLDNSYDPYKAAYSSMPSHSSANPAIRQMYVNGHFFLCLQIRYFNKRTWHCQGYLLLQKNFIKSHPEIVIEKI